VEVQQRMNVFPPKKGSGATDLAANMHASRLQECEQQFQRCGVIKLRKKINHTLLPHQVHAMSDSQRSNPIQQPQRPAQVREFFKQRIAMVTTKVIKAHENPQALLLYDASLQVVADSHSLTESVYRCNDGSHPVIRRHFCDRGGGLRIIF
jgi:hypothetical protein